jgi:hypothetical protein
MALLAITIFDPLNLYGGAERFFMKRPRTYCQGMAIASKIRF